MIDLNPWPIIGNVIGWGLLVIVVLLLAGVIINLVRSTKWKGDK